MIFSAAAIYQGISRPAILKLRMDHSAKVDTQYRKVQNTLAEITLLDDSYINYPLQVLFESLVLVETLDPLFVDANTTPSTCTPKSLLCIDSFRRIAKVWDVFLLCSNKSKCILNSNGGPNLASDKNLVLAEWVETLYLYVMTEEQISFSALNRITVDGLALTPAISRTQSPRTTPKSSPRMSHSPRVSTSSPRNPFRNNRKSSPMSELFESVLPTKKGEKEGVEN